MSVSLKTERQVFIPSGARLVPTCNGKAKPGGFAAKGLACFEEGVAKFVTKPC